MMKLAELALAKLAKQELNGVKVTKLLIEGDSTSAGFEINGMEIEFVIDNSGAAYATALVLGGNTYTDATTLGKCVDWVDYVAKMVKKAIEDQHAKSVTIPEPKIDVAPVVQVATDVIKEEPLTLAETSTPDKAEVKSLNDDIPMLREKIVEEIPVVNPKVDGIEALPPSTNAELDEGVVLQNRRIAEAFERGRKEGYTESRKMNLAEIKKVRRRATISIIIILIVILLVLGFLWIYFGDELGFHVPEFLQFFDSVPQVSPGIELPIPESY